MLVSDESGRQVPDTTIHHLAEAPIDASPVSEIARAYKVFWRKYSTGGNGVAFVSPLGGTQTLVAEKANLTSTPWVGQFPVSADSLDVRLVLRDSFSISGAVRHAGPLPDDVQVSVFGATGGGYDLLARGNLSDNAQWGPLRVAIQEQYDYLAVLRGTGIISKQETLDRPRPEDHLWIEFETSPAATLQVTVTEPNNNPLHGCMIDAWWSSEGDGGSAYSLTDERGVALISGTPATSVFLEASLRGFVQPRVHSVELKEGAANATKIVLERSGIIAGRCTHLGQPVRNFTIVFWSGNPGETRKFEAFSDRDDGSFRVTTAPIGEVTLFAVSDDYPRSDVKGVTVRPDEEAVVELELPDPIEARGKIVDGVTGEPVEGARVQIYTSFQAWYLQAWGNEAKSDAAGEFEVLGFSPGDGRFAIRKEGYAQWLGQGFGVAGETLDLGVIPLPRMQALKMRFASQQEVDFTQYSTAPRGNQFYPRKSFGEDGVVVFEDAGPGWYYITVAGPRSSRAFEPFLYPGEDWDITLPIGPAREVVVDVKAADGSGDHDAVRVQASYSWDGIEIDEVVVEDESGRFVFTELPDAHVTFQASDTEFKVLGAAVAKVEGPGQVVDLVVGGEALHVRVVDRFGDPVPGASIALHSDVPGVTWSIRDKTDANGEFVFPSLGLERVFVSAIHPVHGVASDQRVAREDMDRIVEVRMEGDARIRARLLDGAEPLAGIQTRVWGRWCNFEIGDYPSDATGLVTSGDMKEAEYRMTLRQPGIWPAEHVVRATKSGEPAALQVRRLGGVRIAARNPLGDPLPGATVELVSLEFQQSVADWIAGGLVASPVQGLRTDAQGELVLSGLPNGAYRARLRHGDAQATLDVSVPAKGVASVPVTLK